MARGRPVNISTTLKTYLAQVNSLEKTFAAIQPFTTMSPMSNPAVHPKQAERLVGHLFLSLVAANEQFWEDILLRYIAGARYPNGQSPSLRLSKCSSLKHAYEIFSADPNFSSKDKYLSFSNLRDVVKKARLYLTEGKPYSDIKDVWIQRIADGQKIRNHVAHHSRKSAKEFKTASLTIQGKDPKTDKLHQSFSPGKLLLSPVTSGFDGQSGVPMFEAYIEISKRIAQTIAPS
jgi:hypothetical protein